MINLVTWSLFFLAAGIFTSVTILSAYQILFVPPLIYFTYQAYKNKNFNLPASAYWLLGFSLVALVSLVINFELIPKPSKNFGRVKYFIFGVGGIFVLRAWLQVASNKTKKFLTSTFLVTFIAAGSYALWYSKYGESGRVKGLTDTMRYGYGMGMILLTLIGALLRKEEVKTWLNWKLATTGLIFGLLGLYLTHTRGAFLGLMCGLPFTFYFYRPKLGKIAAAVVAIIIITMGSLYFLNTKKSDSRYLMNKDNESDIIRRSQWQAAIIAFKERPILGWGFSNFHSQLKRIKEENDLDRKDYDDAHSHNLFLEVASGTGIIGLFLFFGVAFYVGKGTIPREQNVKGPDHSFWGIVRDFKSV